MSDIERKEELPFECEWEIGVHPAGHSDDWEHYHPLAKSQKKAEEKAKREARDDMMSNPVVYMATGPYKPADPIRVGREVIEEVFGDD